VVAYPTKSSKFGMQFIQALIILRLINIFDICSRRGHIPVCDFRERNWQSHCCEDKVKSHTPLRHAHFLAMVSNYSCNRLSIINIPHLFNGTASRLTMMSSFALSPSTRVVSSSSFGNTLGSTSSSPIISSSLQEGWKIRLLRDINCDRKIPMLVTPNDKPVILRWLTEASSDLVP
jgi:hypothetical protein